MMSREHRVFLVRDQILGSIVVNFLLNAAIAWLTFRSVDVVPLWGTSSIAADTIGTAFLLPVITSLVVTRLVALDVRRGRLPPLPAEHAFASQWPRRSSLRCGATVGVVSMIVAALPVVAVFAFAGPTELRTSPFIWFKAAFAAALGAFVTPLLGWWALGRVSCEKLLPARAASG